MAARNAEEGAWRRAWEWIEKTGARVAVQERPDGPLYFVKVRPFAEAADVSLPAAVAHLKRIMQPYLDSGARYGPTGGRLDKLREALGGG
jgi:hypothetical protein